MSDKFEAFKSDLEKLCAHHSVIMVINQSHEIEILDDDDESSIFSDVVIVDKTDPEKILVIAYEQLCQRCEENEGQEMHSCPYKREMWGRFEEQCNCCEDCKDVCYGDI